MANILVKEQNVYQITKPNFIGFLLKNFTNLHIFIFVIKIRIYNAYKKNCTNKFLKFFILCEMLKILLKKFNEYCLIIIYVNTYKQSLVTIFKIYFSIISLFSKYSCIKFSESFII